MKTIFRNTLIFIIVIALILLSYMSYSGLYTERIVSSGIYGQVLLGPAEPYFGGQISGGNYVPYAATISVKTADGGSEVARFTSDENGIFKIGLDPGAYLLDPQTGDSLFPRAEPEIINVEKNRLTHITIIYDTGVR